MTNISCVYIFLWKSKLTVSPEPNFFKKYIFKPYKIILMLYDMFTYTYNQKIELEKKIVPAWATPNLRFQGLTVKVKYFKTL